MSGALESRVVGDHGVLLELEDNPAVHALAAAVRERFADQLAEIVPGHRTLLLVWRPGHAIPDLTDLAELARVSSEATAGGVAVTPDRAPITIPVRYDGEDLPAIAQRLGVTAQRVIELHCTPTYTVAFMGFAPGFPYLVGLPGELELPRRQTPRLQVPTGSVAVAAGYCGIYPQSSPGGWHLLGRTSVKLFDAGAEPPSLLAPGDRVRFEAT